MSKRLEKTHWTRRRLALLGIPAVLIPGILLSISLGWNPSKLTKVNNYYSNQAVFPESGIVSTVIDGDTFTLTNGTEVRLLGINTPERGKEGFDTSTQALNALVSRKRVYLEYDRYQDDKYGRVLSWVWIDCEQQPTFLPADYMRISGNESRPGLTENPQGCLQGKLVNEELVRNGNAQPVSYTDRGSLKYEMRLHGD
jgi:endonuclease YncB( thermonuclease family)